MNWNDIEVPKLAYGQHDKFGKELCFMEMTAFLAGEPHSDHPKCACPILTAYGIQLNDSGQEFRDLLTPLVPEMIDTRNEELEAKRLEHIVFSVSRRIVAPVLRGRIYDELVDAILAAQDYDGLRAAAAEAARAAAEAAAEAARAAAEAAAYAAYAAAEAAFRKTAVDILKEAIDLDPDRKPVQLDLGRVEQLKALACS